MSDKPIHWKDKLLNILDGWKNVAWKDEEVEKIAKDRAEICSKCDSNKGNVCVECLCPIHVKCRSMREENDCDLKKWGK